MPIPTGLSLAPYILDEQSDDDLQARYRLGADLERELDPLTPVYPFEVWLDDLRRTPSWVTNHRVAIRDEAGEFAAAGVLNLSYTETNRHLAGFYLMVRPEWRRQGLAKAMLAHLLPLAREDGRSILGAGTVQGHDAEKFLAGIGCEQKMVERRSRLLVADVDRALVERWCSEAAAKSAGYEILDITDRFPDDLVAPFCELAATMNDAPRDDLDMEDWVLTPERFRERETLELESGNRVRTLIARHVESGGLAGFTAIGWHPALPELAWQYGTAVRREHRGKAIGRWLKAEMFTRAVESMPALEFVDTWNAGSNQWMLAINIELGYRPYLHYTDWQGSIEALEQAVAR